MQGLSKALATAGAAGVVLTWGGGATAQAAGDVAAPKPVAGAALEGPASRSLSDAITGGRLLLEVRARQELVDQKKTPVLTETGEAFTVRTRLGWETADWNDLKGLIEFEDVRRIGPEHFAVSVPGAAGPPLNGADKARFPVVNDPEVTELNRLQLTWTPSAAAQATLGRQRILIDDQRFVGNVGWRQDEQTFDAVRLDLTSGRLKLFYAYVARVNRILGEARDWESDSHLAQLAWTPGEQLRLQGFVYALDFADSPANSSITTGIKASGRAQAGPYRLAYNATYARQADYRGATPDYALDYWGVDVAGTAGIWTAKVSYESLEGNGTRGFTTPLATTHAFQGWSDAFVQPLGGAKGFVDGLEDFNVTLNVKPPLKLARLSNLDILVRYHAFYGQRTGARLGREWDAQVQAAITPKLSAAIKYADFERETYVPPGAATPPPSRTKLWFTLEYKL